MKKLKLAFLWHMHQPYYKDDKDNQTLFPWVFLHCIKDYYDMCWYYKKHDSIKATFNLVPSLLVQIESYINNTANDIFLNMLRKDVMTLTSKDKSYLQSYLFLSHEQTMIKPLKRYYELYLKYKSHESIEDFESNEILDLEVLFLLSWCGVYLRENNDLVKQLISQNDSFSQAQKESLLDELIKFLPQVFNIYKELQENNQISLAASPFYHPILPLLIDKNSAKEARADVVLPEVFENFEEFAIKNIQKSKNYFQEKFGFEVTGFWPSEGSVSTKAAQHLANNGLNWICSDEEILFKTINTHNKKEIYKNYTINLNNQQIQIRFRDHFLSDKIGFSYQSVEPKVAVEDFINELKKIYDSYDFSPLVNVILDGENAWEFYENNGYDFFEELYSKLETTPWIQTITMDEISNDSSIQNHQLTHLQSGSWINGNFDIWVGSKQKNEAWEYLSKTYKEYIKHKDSLDEIQTSQIEQEFMIALGSDWFWWYGDDHFTTQASEFDYLFRKHLINIHEYMKLTIPEYLNIPIVKPDELSQFQFKPASFIHPIIKQRYNKYFQWLHCGEVDISKQFAVMDGGEKIIKKFQYGFDSSRLFLRFFGKFKTIDTSNMLVLSLQNTSFSLDFTNTEHHQIQNHIELKSYLEGNKLEIELLLGDIMIDKDVELKFSIDSNGTTIQTFPIYDSFNIHFENFELTNWFV